MGEVIRDIIDVLWTWETGLTFGLLGLSFWAGYWQGHRTHASDLQAAEDRIAQLVVKVRRLRRDQYC